MKHTKWKLVLVTGCSMLVAFAAILLVFQLVMTDYIRRDAVNAIAQQQKTDMNIDDSIQMAQTLLMDDQGYLEGERESPDNYTQNERDLAEWVREQKPENQKILNVEIDHRLYYLMRDTQSQLTVMTKGATLYYVDYTAQNAMMNHVDGALVVVMLLCGIGACLAGVMLGRRIEKDQEQQIRFFENASHELKTPLMSIQGYAEGIQTGVLPNVSQAAEVIMNEADKMTELVDGILCLSKLQSGVQKQNKEKVSIPEVLDDGLLAVEMEIRKRGLQLEDTITPQGTHTTVEADRLWLDRAVTNLLSNAVRHAEHEVRVFYDGKKLEVENDGENIPPEDQKHIFERFYSGKKGNVGIGLSLTKEILEGYGWKIKVESQKGRTVFTVLFTRESIK